MIWIRGATAYRILRRERRMLTAALEAKVDAYLAELAGERDGRGIRGHVLTVASSHDLAVVRRVSST
jgi:hypothetical protein